MASTIGELLYELVDAAKESKEGFDTPIQGYNELGNVNVVVTELLGAVYIEEVKG